MDTNAVLIWMVAAIVLVNLFHMIRGGARDSAGWIGVSVAILAAMGGSWLIWPDGTGFIGAGLCAGLIVAPARMQASASRWLIKGDYRRAGVWARRSRLLHPFDGYWQTPQVVEALELNERGDEAGAVALLTRLASSREPTGRTATLHLLRIQRRWDELIERAKQIKPGSRLASVSTIADTLRAMGETGDLPGMVRMFEARVQPLGGPRYAQIRAMSRMFIFAYCGRSEALAAMLGPDRTLQTSGQMREYWLAVSELAAGNRAAAEARFAAIHAAGVPALRNAIDRRLAVPRPPAVELLGPDGMEAVLRIEHAWEQEQRYAGAHVRRGRAVVTLALIGLNLAAFALEMICGGSQDGPTLFRLGALYGPAVEAGQWWRLITANFLHFGPMHLLMNMFALYLLGPFVEGSLGRVRYTVLYMLSGIGGLATVMLSMRMGWTPPLELALGASAAIMGLIGATGTIMLIGWLRERALIAVQRLRTVGLVVAMQVIFDMSFKNVSSSAHLGGLAVGFVIALCLKSRTVRPQRVSRLPATG